MIIDVKQVKVTEENKFQIFVNGCLKYIGTTPPFKCSTDDSNLNEDSPLQLKTLHGHKVLHTTYDELQKKAGAPPQAEWLSEDSAEVKVLNILNNVNTLRGGFYESKQGWFDKRFAFSYNGESFFGYFKATIQQENITIYNESDVQIAQIIQNKSIHRDQLDLYKIYLEDEHSYLIELLSLFTLYFAIKKTTPEGQHLINKEEIASKNDSKYDPMWIAEHGRKASIPLHSPQSRTSVWPFLIGVFFAISLPFFFLSLFTYTTFSPAYESVADEDFSGIKEVILGEDSIPTLYAVTKSPEADEVEYFDSYTDNDTITAYLIYKEDMISEELLMEYHDFLLENGFTLTENNDSECVHYSKDAQDSDSILDIEFMYISEGQLQISYQKFSGIKDGWSESNTIL